MNNINSAVKIERAISELRRGGKVVISDVDTGISVLLNTLYASPKSCST